MLNQSLKVSVRNARPADASVLAEIFRDSWLPQLGLGPAKCEKSLRMGLGMMVAPARRGKPPIEGYSGIAGCAVGVDVDKGHHAFLTTFQWSSPTSSFAAVASLLRSTRA